MDVSTEPASPAVERFPAPRRRQGPGLFARTVLHDRRELTRFWPVVSNLVVQDLRVRYQRSMLGFFWTLLNPVLMMGIQAFVFSKVFKTVENYPLFLFAGMVPWNFMGTALNESAFCIIQNENLIRKIYIPKLIFPLSKVLINLTTFTLSMGALFVLMVPLGAKFSLSLLALPVVLGLFFVFVLGLSLLVATANTFYRDTGHLVAVFLQAWYYATPILYPTTFLPEDYRWRMWLNPAFPFIRMFQVVLVDGLWPEWTMVAVAGAFAAVSLGVGYAAFKSSEDKLVFRL